MFQYPQTQRQSSPHLTTRSLCCTYMPRIVRFCPELSPVALKLSAPVRNGPFLSEILSNSFKVSPSTNSFARWHLQCYMYTPAMTKSTPYLYRDALEKLATEPPTTKTALLCSLLSEIEGALRSGKTHKQVWQRLSDSGLDISCETFCRLVRRARKKPRTSASRGGESVEVPEGHARQTATGVEHDPLVNLRRVEASRPGFHYRGTENLDVLVYGRRESRGQSKR
jgi:hypothetical protein